ncbi:MAG: ATP-dependent helicase [Thermofilum sp.]|jgi:ATP-dependent Lhr-like helicase|nr:ATP-dependent helicase [Thermofilum sp.]MCC6064340.1 ATP-dependent helicase [Thermofilum sp.]
MLTYAEREYSKEEVLSLLHPLVAEWFRGKYEDLTPPQKLGVVPIYEGKNVLISSPTGTGKTLTAFLVVLSELIKMGLEGKLNDSIYAVYVSPLRALNNDIYRNLEEPLSEIRELAARKGIELPEIRHAVRTGDTTQNERQKMLRKPPHILITTPETLAIVLVAPKFREKLRSVKWVIVDEIHSLAENKRGVHLTLSLERLQELVGHPFVRIGLSATINPLEEVAQFLVGFNDDGTPRDCVIVDARYVKRKDIRVLAPAPDLLHTPAQELQSKMYELVYDLVMKHRTSLIFTNTRSGTERVVFHLKVLGKEKGGLDESQVMAHHGSLSRVVRHEVEEKLKAGQLKAVVSSTSLELGIDIGYIDVVVQIGSPKSVTRCLQRIGRSGHRLHDTIRGRMVCVDRDDLVEVAVMVKEAYRNHLDRVHIPRNALDVLAQHIVGMAIERKWSVEEAYRLVRRSYCYRDLPMEDFVRVLKYLSGQYGELESYRVYGKIWFDEKEGVFGRRGKYARAIYALNVGTIPEEVNIKVYTAGGKYVGNIEEEFLERLVPGDRFILGGKVYEFVEARGDRAFVKPAFDMKPTVPSWFSEMLPLSYDLALRIGEFRDKMFEWLKRGKPKKEIVAYIVRNCRANLEAAEAIYQYFAEMHAFLEALGVREHPSHRTILVERYVDERGRLHHVFHTLYGRRVNDALSRALAYLASVRAGVNVGIAVHDNGFALVYPPGVKPPVSVTDLKSSELEELLKRAISNTELMKRKFRHVATRALMILRNYKGHEISVERQQMNAQTLLKVVKELGDDFPVLKETYREILEDYMDVEHAKEVLRGIEEGRIKVVELPELDVPSPFAYNIVLEGLSDVVLMEDKRLLMLRFRERLMKLARMASPEALAA